MGAFMETLFPKVKNDMPRLQRISQGLIRFGRFLWPMPTRVYPIGFRTEHPLKPGEEVLLMERPNGRVTIHRIVTTDTDFELSSFRAGMDICGLTDTPVKSDHFAPGAPGSAVEWPSIGGGYPITFKVKNLGKEERHFHLTMFGELSAQSF